MASKFIVLKKPPLVKSASSKPRIGKPSLIIPGSTKRDMAAAKAVKGLGEPVSHGPTKNCLTCSRFLNCKDPHRKPRYRCTRWAEIPVLDGSGLDLESLMSRGLDTAEKDRVIPKEEILQKAEARRVTRGESSLEKMVDSALDVAFSGSFADFEIDDSDLPLAPNFWEWVSGKRYLGLTQMLFARQLEIALKLHGEICYKCSDEAFLEKVPVDCTPENFMSKAVLLKHGVCPRCKSRRSEMVKDGTMNDYYTLAGAAGQRGGKCVHPSTLLLTNEGIRRIGDVAETLGVGKYGTTSVDFSLSNEKGLRHSPRMYKSRAERLLRLQCWNGLEITATAVHPMLTGWKSAVFGEKKEFTRMSDLSVGQVIPVHVGQGIWASTAPSLQGAANRSTRAFKKWHSNVPATNKHQVKAGLDFVPYQGAMTEGLAELLGWHTAEGASGNYGVIITQHDQSMLRRMSEISQSLFGVPGELTSRSGTKPENFVLPGYKAWAYFDELFDNKFEALSRRRFIPSIILSSPRQFVVAFLRSLYEGDGGMDGDDLCYYTTSRRLAAELHVILSNLGFAVRKIQGWSWAANGSSSQISRKTYTLSICGKHFLRKFQAEVGFLSKRKKDALSSAIKRQASRSLDMPHWHEKFPEEVKAEFLEVWNEALGQIRSRSKGLNPKGKGHVIGRETLYGKAGWERRLPAPNVSLSRQRVLKTLSPMMEYAYLLDSATSGKLESFRKLALNRSVYFTSIESVSIMKKASISYDLEVPKGHRFMANGLVAHNTLLVAASESYQIHRWVKFPSPQATYKIMTQQPLLATYVALTATQAQENLWDPIMNFVEDSPWFKGYHALLDSYGEREGQEVYALKETFLQYNHRRLLMSLSGPNKRTLRGRCLVGSTLVNTNQGFQTIKEVVGDGYGYTPAEGLLIDSPNGQKKVSHLYKGKSRTIKVTTANGYEVEGTPEHPMLVLTPDWKYVWRRLDQMKEGDYIVSRTGDNNPAFGNNSITKDMATLLGYMTANGHGVSFCSQDIKVIRNFKRVGKAITGLLPKKWKNSADKVPVYGLRRGGRGHANGGVQAALFDPVGYSFRNSTDKEIIPAILQAPKDVLHEFLEAYFECDCHVDGGSRTSGAPHEVVVGSASEKLARQLHVLLLHIYGLVGRLRHQVYYDRYDTVEGRKEVRGGIEARRDHWSVTFTGYDAHRFLLTFKRAKVQRYSNSIHAVVAGVGSDRRNIPYGKVYLSSLFEKARLVDGTGRKLRRIKLADGSVVWNKIGPTFLRTSRAGGDHVPEGIFYDQDWPSILERLSEIDPEAGRRAEKVVSRNAHYERVVSVVKGKKRKAVYDVTVPEGHAFTANGLASHNTRFSYSVDEIGWFPYGDDNKDKTKMSAEEVYQAGERSMTTLVSGHQRLRDIQGLDNLPKPLVTAISSPVAVDDMIMKLYNSSINSKFSLGFKYATWDMNPTLSRETDPIMRIAFERDAVAAMRDYGAQPPMSSNAWVSEKSNVAVAFHKKLRNNATVQQYRFTSKAGLKRTSGQVKVRQSHSGGRIMTFDASITRNSFAYAVGYWDPYHDVVVTEALGEVQPNPKAPISFNRIFEDMLGPLAAECGVNVVVADTFQSEKMLEDISETYGPTPMTRKVKYADFEALRDDLYEKKIIFPRLEMEPDEVINGAGNYPSRFIGKPAAHLMYQMLTVRDYPGDTVEKGQNATDDLFRCVVLLHWACKDSEVRDLLFVAPPTPSKAIGVLASGDAAGGVKSNNFGASSSRAEWGAGGSQSGSGHRGISRASLNGQPIALGSLTGRKA